MVFNDGDVFGTWNVTGGTGGLEDWSTKDHPINPGEHPVTMVATERIEAFVLGLKAFKNLPKGKLVDAIKKKAKASMMVFKDRKTRRKKKKSAADEVQAEDEEEGNTFQLGERVKLTKGKPGCQRACCGLYLEQKVAYLDWAVGLSIMLNCVNWLQVYFFVGEFHLKQAYDLDSDPSEFVTMLRDVDELIQLFAMYSWGAGLTSTLLLTKNAITLSFYPPIKVILNTISGAIEDIVLFLALFMLILVGFALFAHIVMGHTIVAFESPITAILKCMDILVGNFDSAEHIYSKNLDSTVIQTWYYVFNILMVWILINLFIGILDLAYKKAKGTYDRSPEKSLIIEMGHAFTWISNPTMCFPSARFLGCHVTHGFGVGSELDTCVLHTPCNP